MSQFGVPFTLTGPDGTVAVFNDPSDPDYVGFLSDVSGLDSPEVRENFDDKVESDGGLHGSFWYSRRPVVMQGFIDHSTTTDRNQKAAKIRRATNAMRSDAELTWTPDGEVEKRLLLRRQQPVRITGAWNKQFMLPMVSAFPLIESSAEHSESAELDLTSFVVVNNAGDSPVPALVRLDGSITNINEVRNATTSEDIDLGANGLSDGNYIEIDLAQRTVVLNGTTNIYSVVNFATTNWWLLQPGNNTISIPAASATGVNSELTVTWRDGWI